jgi:hypothetical protein
MSLAWAGNLPFVLPEHATQQMTECVVRVNFERLLQCVLRLVHAVILVEELSLAAPGFRIAGVFGGDFIHHAQGCFMLSLFVLAKSFIDLDVDRLTAPLEFFAAAARTGGVRINDHARLLVSGE